MMSRRLFVLICVAVATVAAAGALRLLTPERTVPPQTSVADRAVAARLDSTSLSSADQPPAANAVASAPAGDRFALAGVVAASGRDGFALISVNGQPARAFGVGATVKGDIVVREVSASGVTLGPRDGGAAIALEASVTPAPATGTSALPLPGGVSGIESGGPLYDGSAKSKEVLRKIGSKYPPLAPQAASAPMKPVDGTASNGDDGSWKGPSGR
jgi:general secretion pathway protein C